jgi:uncharacterized protein (UPF0335 family)
VESNDLNDEQKAALFIGGVERLERLIEQKDEVVARIRSQRKAMKSDGFMRPEVDYALWARKQEEGSTEADMAMRVRISEWLGKPVGFQATFDLAAQ